jgi:hypothetical protein
MGLWSRLRDKVMARSSVTDAPATEPTAQREVAPINADPHSRGYDKEFRLPTDAEYVARLNQRTPKGLPRKVAEFVAVVGIAQPATASNARAFIAGQDRTIELSRLPNHAVDPNAVAVIGHWTESGAARQGHLGFLPADVAASIARDFATAPLAATVKVLYAPGEGRNAGVRLDIWTSRRKIRRASEQPYDETIRVPDDSLARNLLGAELEAKGLVDNAIEYYESNVRDGFDGNYPYDRLAVIYRRRLDREREVAVLRRAVEVFERLHLTSPRADVASKLENFRARLDQANAQSAKGE